MKFIELTNKIETLNCNRKLRINLENYDNVDEFYIYQSDKTGAEYPRHLCEITFMKRNYNSEVKKINQLSSTFIQLQSRLIFLKNTFIFQESIR